MPIDDVNIIRDRLLARRGELLRRVAQFEDELRWLDAHQSAEIEEESQEQNIARLLARLDDRSAAEIDQIDRALQRLTDGEYFDCEACGEPIAPERLEALPTATLCIVDAELRERQSAGVAG
jgi:RNA polymerase-binding protein DksA